MELWLEKEKKLNSFTIEFEINQACMDLDLIRRKADYAPIPKQLAAQLIDRLNNHKEKVMLKCLLKTIFIQNLPRISSEIKTSLNSFYLI